MGLREKARASTAEAVSLYRELAKQRPNVFGPNLAMSLNNLGVLRRELGLEEDGEPPPTD